MQGRSWTKGPQSTTSLFLFTRKSLAIIFCSEHVEMKEITVKLRKVVFKTYFLFTIVSIVLMASKMAEADQGPLRMQKSVGMSKKLIQCMTLKECVVLEKSIPHPHRNFFCLKPHSLKISVNRKFETTPLPWNEWLSKGHMDYGYSPELHDVTCYTKYIFRSPIAGFHVTSSFSKIKNYQSF